MLREYGGDFLLYRIVDKVVDELQPVIDAYAARLTYFHKEIQRYQRWFRKMWREELEKVKLELYDLKRIAQPLRQTVRHFIKEKHVEDTIVVYFENVEDHMESIWSDIELMLGLINAIEERYERYVDSSNNRLLFIFTVITTVFLPGQFLAAVYGMNFVNADTHEPAMPELLWKHGYAYFWLCAALLSVFTFCLSYSCYRPARCWRDYKLRRRDERQKKEYRTSPRRQHSVKERQDSTVSRIDGLKERLSSEQRLPRNIREESRERLLGVNTDEPTPPISPLPGYSGLSLP